jgi:hypothetical protein
VPRPSCPSAVARPSRAWVGPPPSPFVHCAQVGSLALPLRQVHSLGLMGCACVRCAWPERGTAALAYNPPHAPASSTHDAPRARFRVCRWPWTLTGAQKKDEKPTAVCTVCKVSASATYWLGAVAVQQRRTPRTVFRPPPATRRMLCCAALRIACAVHRMYLMHADRAARRAYPPHFRRAAGLRVMRCAERMRVRVRARRTGDTDDDHEEHRSEAAR